jgi:hypothetical protein
MQKKIEHVTTFLENKKVLYHYTPTYKMQKIFAKNRRVFQYIPRAALKDKMQYIHSCFLLYFKIKKNNNNEKVRKEEHNHCQFCKIANATILFPP